MSVLGQEVHQYMFVTVGLGLLIRSILYMAQTPNVGKTCTKEPADVFKQSPASAFGESRKYIVHTEVIVRRAKSSSATISWVV